MPRGDNRRAMIIAQTRKDVAQLHMKGYNQQAIADKLGKDQSTISRMLKRLRGDLQKEAVQDMGEVRAVQNARLENILKEYWELFSNGNMEKPETAVAGALKTVSEISKLLGVNINPTQVIDQKVTQVDTDPAALASKLASVFSDDNIVDGELVQPAALEHDAQQPDDAHQADAEHAPPHQVDGVGDAEEPLQAPDIEPEEHSDDDGHSQARDMDDGADVAQEPPQPAEVEHRRTMPGTEARRAEDQERAAALADQLARRFGQ